MAKFNRGTVRPAVHSAVTSEQVPSGRTALGAAGYARDLKSELFLLAAGNLPGEKAFHEGRDARVLRFRDLVREASATDPEWAAGLLQWLRGDGNLRLAPVIGAAEFAWARRDEAGTGRDAGVTVFPRQVVSSVLQRADEPGEIIAYWMQHYGRKIPVGLKRGVADVLPRLYTQRSMLKYDTAEAAFRFGDVIELVQPRYVKKLYGTDADALFRYAIERRHSRGNPLPEQLALLHRHALLMALPQSERRAFLSTPDAAQVLRDAGVTHEALAGWLHEPLGPDGWAAVIPSMGYMALLRNLTNFDRAGVTDDVAATVAAKLSDPGEVARSRQFPFRFLSAYRAAPSLRWAQALETALNLSLGEVPSMPGRTLVLVDRSPSMWMQHMSEHSDMPWADAAAVFGAAIALRAQQATLAEFWGLSQEIHIRRGESLLRLTERFSFQPAPGGTDIPSAVRKHYAGHDRVVIVTDEQTAPGWLPSNMQWNGGSAPALINDLIPENVPLYVWNFGGYKHGATPSGTGNRHTFGGLTDSSFRAVSLLEAGRDAAWPWEQRTAA